ncbi:MAG: L-seryl-tRNA(Sec) selenium transferase [Fimbriimonadaceae bacterium]|nr:L-seryl-tRNA(Sec) selenium transferase [Fimbriimonadaceae bacterium]
MLQLQFAHGRSGNFEGMPNPARPPSVDKLKSNPVLAPYSEAIRSRAGRAVAQSIRDGQLIGENGAIEAALLDAAEYFASTSLKPAINATGVILHTGLGRARLSNAATESVTAVAGSNATLEISLETGERGDRQSHVRELLRELTGAEDALVVNNCAGALYLSLAALCRGGGVILSRGQMVEIGGSFRMPDIIADTGCRLVEVGCTNRTRLSDYERAVGEDTKAILRCSPSNFQMTGFVSQPELGELAALAQRSGSLLIDDLGHGCLIDVREFGLRQVTTLGESISAGSHLVLGSGDKLLGGPQAGIAVGSNEAIAAMKKHPLARAFRIDKLSLAALAATLTQYRDGTWRSIPLWTAVSRTLETVKKDAKAIARSWHGAEIQRAETEIGGGSLPGEGIPTWRVGLAAPDPVALATLLRNGKPSIFGRIERDRVWLDPRTLDPDEVRAVAKRLKELAA